MGFFSGITGVQTAIVDAAKDAAEVAAYVSFGIPLAVAVTIQVKRKDWGLPQVTDPLSLAMVAIVLSLIFTGIVGIVYGIFSSFIGIFTTVGSGKSAPRWKVIVFCVCIGFLISLILYYIFVRKILLKSKIDVAANIASQISKMESFANQAPETSLINLQTLAVKQVAYIGPNENDGSFDEEIGVKSVLQTGTRVFIFQIGYLEVQKDSTKFEEPYMPTLLYRDDAGKLISENGANIGKVAKNLAAYAFADQTKNASNPLIIYLHFERTPNVLREPEKYIKFLSSVAQLLEPLQEFMVGATPSGNFQRQQNESTILTTPISTFEKKVLFFSNADTSIFRNLASLNMETIDTKYDLDYIVNVRVYLDDAADSLGVTKIPMNGERPNAVIVPFKRIEALRDDEQDEFATKGKTRFTIAMPSQMKNPSIEDIQKALNMCSVNCIPLNMFGESIEELTKKVKIWKGEPFYKVKAPNYQAVAPAVPVMSSE